MLSFLRRLNSARVIQSRPTQAKVRSPWVWKANSAPGGGIEYVRQVYGYEIVAAQFAGNGLGTANILCSAHLKLDFRFDENALKNAWLHLRARFPQIASQTRPVVPADPIRMVEMLYRSPRSSCEAQDWVEATVFSTPSPPAEARDIVGDFTSDISKLDSFDMSQLCWAAHLHYTQISDNEVVLAIVCTHIASDGRQSMIYLDELIKALLSPKALTQPQWGGEVELLKLPLAMELGLRNEHSDHPPDMAEFLGSRAAFMPDGPSRLPFSSHEGLPADAMSRDYRNYDQETTELIRLAFKRRGVTFTRGMSAVITAANWTAMLRLHPDFLEGLPEWFVDHANPMDCRHYRDYNSMSVVFAMIRTRHSDLERIIEECGAQDIASQLHMAPSFWEYVKHVNEEWEREKSLASKAVQYADEMCQAFAKGVQQPSGPAFAPCFISSSLGIMESCVQREYTADVKEDTRKIEVLDVRPTVRNPSPNLFNHYYTFRGRLSTNQVIGSKWLNPEELATLGREVQRWLTAIAAGEKLRLEAVSQQSASLATLDQLPVAAA